MAALLILAGLAVFTYAALAGRDTPATSQTTQPSADAETIATGLVVPWQTVVLPDGDILVTERPGTLKRIGADERSYAVEGVQHVGEGGLLGLALHPKFSDNNWLYVYLTTTTGGQLSNRVERYTYSASSLSDRQVVIDNIPGAANHDGGALAFGPDGYLYITTGDAGDEGSAQDRAALTGKILRLTDSGAMPADNPFQNAVYSYGHRNPQGLAWDANGQLWATEHGRSGAQSGYDELNLIQKGANYGWPVIEGDETRQGMQTPVLHSGADDTWAPSGLAYWSGSLYFGGLRGQALYEAKLDADNSATLTKHFSETYGRLRGVTVIKDNGLLITTSNRDGRGNPSDSDDRIIRVKASALQD